LTLLVIDDYRTYFVNEGVSRDFFNQVILTQVPTYGKISHCVSLMLKLPDLGIEKF
jgi:hypothetical protein